MNKPILSDYELEEIYEKAYLKACDFSERYASGLSSKNWNPERPADRLRFFNETSRDVIQRATAQAQYEATVKWLCEEVEKALLTDDEMSEALCLYEEIPNNRHCAIARTQLQKVLALLRGDKEEGQHKNGTQEQDTLDRESIRRGVAWEIFEKLRDECPRGSVRLRHECPQCMRELRAKYLGEK